MYGVIWFLMKIICAFRFHIHRTWFLYNVGANSFSQCNWVTRTAINQLVDNDEMFMGYASNLLWCNCSKSYSMRTKAYIAFLLIFGHIRYRIQVLPSVVRGKLARILNPCKNSSTRYASLFLVLPRKELIDLVDYCVFCCYCRIWNREKRIWKMEKRIWNLSFSISNMRFA
jgi:hypothetical protein